MASTPHPARVSFRHSDFGIKPTSNDKEDDTPEFQVFVTDAHDNKTDAKVDSTSAVVICCALIFLALLVVGVALSMQQAYQGKDVSTAVRVGHIFLLVCGILLVTCCCMCCVACALQAAPLDENDKEEDNKYPKWVFARVNDRHKKDKQQHAKLLRQTAARLPKKAENLFKTLETQEKKKLLTSKTEWEDALVTKLEAEVSEGKSLKAIKQSIRKKVYVLEFHADKGKHQVETLADQISLVLQVASRNDRVVVVLTSPGGTVNTYGLASSQLVRIKNAGLHLTICVDSIAASGGYLMACIGDEIVAAPFAYIGSIGVVTYIPNVQRVLDKHDVDMHLITAGKFKRTVDVVGEVTAEGKQKLKEELEDIHFAFKEQIRLNRPSVDVDAVATGEAWLAVQAKEKGLVDEIMTSDDYLLKLSKTCDVLELKPFKKDGLLQKALFGMNEPTSVAGSVGGQLLRGLWTLAAVPLRTGMSFGNLAQAWATRANRQVPEFGYHHNPASLLPTSVVPRLGDMRFQQPHSLRAEETGAWMMQV